MTSARLDRHLPSAPTASWASTTTCASAARTASWPAPTRRARSCMSTSIAYGDEPMASRRRQALRPEAHVGGDEVHLLQGPPRCTPEHDRPDRPAVDPEVTPACVNSCISGAMAFGNIEDPEQQRQPAAGRDQNLPHARGTGDRARRVLHLGPSHEANNMERPARELAAPFLGNWLAPTSDIKHTLAPDNWDWRAAGNFIAGGSRRRAAAVFRGSPQAWNRRRRAHSGRCSRWSLIGLGLTCVWFEIGRPWRALNVYPPHSTSSWMTREARAICAVPVRQPAVWQYC
jgi:hypothetical protein